jgi:hypothetical protein
MSDTTKTPSTRADVCLRAAADALDNAELPYYESSQQRMGGLIELMDRAAELLRAAAEQAPESPSRNCAYCGCEARGVEPREQPVAEVQGDGFEISWLNRSPMPKGTKLYAPTTAEVDALRAEITYLKGLVEHQAMFETPVKVFNEREQAREQLSEAVAEAKRRQRDVQKYFEEKILLENANAALRAEIEKLKALSVTNILIEITPGIDGCGEEIYAKSVKDVEDEMTRLGVESEDAKGELNTLRSSLAVAREALLENASYREGELSSSMDEPYAAEVAREALDKLDALDKGEAG